MNSRTGKSLTHTPNDPAPAAGLPPAWVLAAVLLPVLVVVPDSVASVRLARAGLFATLMALAWLRAVAICGVPVAARPVGTAIAWAAALTVLPAIANGDINLVSHVLGASQYVCGALFAAAVAGAMQSGQRLQTAVANAAGLLVLVLSATTVAQALGAFPLIAPAPDGPEFQAPGILGNPNWTASWLAAFAPLALLCCRSFATRLVGASLVVAAVLCTRSVGGALALGAALAVAAVCTWVPSPRHRTAIGLALIALPGIVLLAAGPAGLGWAQLTARTAGRSVLWRCALDFFSERPLLGHGIDQFGANYGRLLADFIAANPDAQPPLGDIRFVHNDYLQTALEGGIVALVLHLAVVTLCLHRGSRGSDPLSTGAVCGIVALCVHGWVDSPLHVPATFAAFWFFVGLVARRTSEDATSAAQAKPLFWRDGVSKTIGFLLGLVILATGVRTCVGWLFWNLGSSRSSLAPKGGTVVRESRLALAVALLPEVGELRSERARLLHRMGKKPEAQRELRTASLYHFSFEDRILLTRWEGGSIATQRQRWQSLSTQYPMLLTPLIELAQLEIASGHIESARAYLHRVLETVPAGGASEGLRQRAAELLQGLHG